MARLRGAFPGGHRRDKELVSGAQLGIRARIPDHRGLARQRDYPTDRERAPAAFGWRQALAAVCIPSVLLLAWWQYDARDLPAEHPAVARRSSRFAEDAGAAEERVSLARIMHVLVDHQVLLITASYLLMNYVFYLVTFWSFLYLRQERGVTVLESGWLASLPFLAAAVSSAAGGQLSDSLIGVSAPLGYRVSCPSSPCRARDYSCG